MVWHSLRIALNLTVQPARENLQAPWQTLLAGAFMPQKTSVQERAELSRQIMMSLLLRFA